MENAGKGRLPEGGRTAAAMRIAAPRSASRATGMVRRYGHLSITPLTISNRVKFVGLYRPTRLQYFRALAFQPPRRGISMRPTRQRQGKVVNGLGTVAYMMFEPKNAILGSSDSKPPPSTV